MPVLRSWNAGRAVHEHGLFSGGVHELLIDLIGEHLLQTLGPGFHRLAHGDPDVSVEHVRTGDGFCRVRLKGQRCAGLGGNGLAAGDERGIGEVASGPLATKCMPSLAQPIIREFAIL